MSPGCIARGASERGEDLHGGQGFIDFQARMIEVFPDIHFEVLDCIGSGDKVAVRWFATMHHNGNGLGTDPTGAEVKFAGMGFARLLDGKIVETWDTYDKHAMFQQIEAAAKAKSAKA